MKHRLILLILCFICVSSMPQQAFAAPHYVPVRNIFESFGAVVSGGEKTITIHLPHSTVTLRPGGNTASKNGKQVPLYKPIIREDNKALIHVLDIYKLAKSQDKEKHYRVQPGETLSMIAKVTGVTVEELRKWNHLKSDDLRVGQHLHLTDPMYTVKPGDSLWEIAKANETSVKAIKEANNLTLDFLQIGQSLYIPVQPSMKPPEMFVTGYFPLMEGTYQRFGNDFDSTRVSADTEEATVHEGIDLLAPEWNPVFASFSGKVTAIGRDNGGGWHLRILAPNGVAFYYANLNGFPEGIKVGQPISRGQLIGYVGGANQDNDPHLHFGMYDTNTTPEIALNPYYYLKWWEMRP